MFIGGLSWQTTQGEPARGSPAGPRTATLHPLRRPKPGRPCPAPRPADPGRPRALFRAPPRGPRERSTLGERARPGAGWGAVVGVGVGSGGMRGGGLGPRDPPAAALTPLAPAAQTFVEAAPGAAGTQPERSPTPARPRPLPCRGPGGRQEGSAGTPPPQSPARAGVGGPATESARGQLGAGAAGPRRGHQGQRTEEEGEGLRAWAGPKASVWLQRGCANTSASSGR